MAAGRDAAGFADDLNRFGEQLDKGIDVERRRLAEEIFERVVERTPVDTGELRDAWVLEHGNKGVSEIRNDSDHALAVEFGHSSQAPQGMVRITLAEIEAELREFTRRRK